MNMISLFASLVVAVLLGLSDGGSHSLRYFYTGISGISEFPDFVALGYVDDQIIGKYKSTNQVYKPEVQWMEENMDQNYWDTETQTDLRMQQLFKANVKTLMDRTNQTTGIHSLQVMYGCSMNDGTISGSSGFLQYGYDGLDYITFDKETKTWTAVAPTAFITKNKWDPDTASNMQAKGYLEQTCIEWLQKYIKYGQTSLRRKVPPEVKMTDKTESGSTELKCRAHGFYPRDIDLYFVKGDNDRIETTTSSGVLPNSDGTYYTEKWIEIDPQDKYHYSCQVEHESLEPKQIVKFDRVQYILIDRIIIAAVVMILTVVIAVVV